ncbi:Crp/Fnr family transcriptional regulator [Paenibacillus sp. CN-4]|uniref:Crp/Fnr family transcriptional regulator n=1 Tax=Paenibacillus nanchangensis TaxID=3348343 RepID=UPI003978CC73
MKIIQDEGGLAGFLSQLELETVLAGPLREQLALVSFDVGERICSQGDAADTLYIFVEGRIKVYTTSPSGSSLILSCKTPLDAIGDIEYFRRAEIMNTVEAVTQVRMIAVPYRALDRYGREHAPLLAFLLDIITRKFMVKSDALSFNLMHPVEVRLAKYLLSIASRGPDSGPEEVQFPLNARDTANLIGTSYRHLNRMIQKFSEDGLIHRTKGSVQIRDRERLCNLAGQ